MSVLELWAGLAHSQVLYSDADLRSPKAIREAVAGIAGELGGLGGWMVEGIVLRVGVKPAGLVGATMQLQSF
jgi:hypothetical protein